jgi:hypothetical protein
LAFDPVEANLSLDDGREGPWRVRRATLVALQAACGATTWTDDMESIQRANKLLAAHLRNVLGEEPATMTWTFGRLPVGGQRPRQRGRA